MKGIFYASGPKLKQNFTLNNSSLLYNVDLFNLMCILLNIEKCPPSNGTLANIKPFLKSQGTVIDTIILSIGLSLVVLMGIIWSIASILNGLKKDSETQFSPINNPRVASAVESEQA